MNEFINFLNDSVIVMDADAYFDSHIGMLQSIIKNKDVGIYSSRGPNGMVPWRKYWAGLLYVNNTKEGQIFADILRKAHFYLWNTSRPNWWIDQNAIFYAVDFVYDALGQISFAELRISSLPIATGEGYKKMMLTEFKSRND